MNAMRILVAVDDSDVSRRVASYLAQVVSDVLNVAKTDRFGTIVIGRTRLARWPELFRHHVADELVHRAREVSVWVVA